ncbi:hypothetical protein PsYK624_060470 [Phanerochaete sordida]|uniref:C2H2-type domain-containing protein n=1 Tax=Phanerochaete sordida TaxID=48140 RepID=A0A9P3LCU5_9APHY|nr:hypothetical protein PsYK624_060470 [Phanerochaete sordida]
MRRTNSDPKHYKCSAARCGRRFTTQRGLSLHERCCRARKASLREFAEVLRRMREKREKREREARREREERERRERYQERGVQAEVLEDLQVGLAYLTRFCCIDEAQTPSDDHVFKLEVRREA